MAALTEERVLAALLEAGVPGPGCFEGFLTGLHKTYYRTPGDFKRFMREGLASTGPTGLPGVLVDSVMACQAGNACDVAS